MSSTTLQKTMLFDFFGDLLTEKQRDYFDLYHNEDLSLSEIADMAGISRQGVYDIITRAEKTLDDFEQKTGIVRRWSEMRSELKKAGEIAQKLQQQYETEPPCAKLTQQLLIILNELQDK
ncbi:MAG: YlxM family DNA-binding protein [Oscillospiraceae bacterium]|nr:YlxM family DNA-binding protein [Oscillospiraceae bacterium]